MATGTYNPSNNSVEYNTTSAGVKYNYSTGGTTFGLSIYSSTGATLCRYTSSTAISTEVSSVVGVLQSTLAELQQSYAAQQKTLTRLEQELQNPNLTPAQRAAKQADIDDFKSGTMADTQTEISDCQSAISTVQSSAAGIFQGMKQTWDQNQPSNTAQPAPTATAPTAPAAAPANATPSLAGTASDDSGVKQPNTAGTTGAPTASPAAAPGAAGSATPAAGPAGTTSTPTNATTGGYKWQSSYVSEQPSAGATKPGKRLQNPLGEFSSYTYQLTLYMITPDAYEAFVATGRTKINLLNDAANAQRGSNTSGAYIVAQSGGVNKSTSQRAPSFDFDYGIDDLQMKSLISGKQTGNPSFITELSFKITEPYGFSFLTNLRKAGDTLFGSTPANPDNTLRQMFVLGIRFLGYDASGRVMLPNTKMASGSGIVDPTSISGDLFEYFIDIKITSMKFKIDGRSVTYNIKAVQQNTGNGFSVSRGFLKSDKTVTKSNAGDAIDELITAINTEQQNYAKGNPPSQQHPTKYEIIWMPGTEEIYTASIVSEADVGKTHWPGSGATSTSEANAGREANAQAANSNATQVQLAHDQPIIQCISQIIMRSSFLENQLSAIYTTQVEADPEAKSQEKIKPAYQSRTLSWFNVTPQISDIVWDNLTSDWSYTIKYLITKYDTPIIDSPMVNGNNLYPGPHKRYEYWYTGENSEVIQYEQVLDNTYMQVVVGVGDSAIGASANNATSSSSTSSTTGTTNPPGSNSVAPVQPGLQSNMPTLGRTGYGFDAQNSFLTSLFDAASFLKAKVKILGDPDLLPSGPTYSEQLIYDKYYAGTNGYSVNASGGQVFIEINFKEAVDYTSQTGTMNINDSIAFTRYPPKIAEDIKSRGGGVSYTVLSVVSSFSGGSFTQTLDTILNTFNNADATADAAGQARAESTEQAALRTANEAAAQSEQTASTGPNGQAATTNAAQTTGTPTAPPQTTGNTPTTQSTSNAAPATNANDDSSSTNTPPQVPAQGRTG